jgi:hypothetical protein
MAKKEVVTKAKNMSKGLKITLIILAVIGVIFLLIIGLFIFAGLMSGGFGYSEVLPIADEFYMALQTQDYAKADSLLDPIAVNETLKTEFNKFFKYVDDKLGLVETHSKNSFDSQSFTSGESLVVVTYNVNRTKYSALETLRFYRPSKEDKYHK